MIRNAITALALLAISVSAHADPTIEKCNRHSEAAESIMSARQDGLSVHQIYSWLDESDKEASPTFRRMVADAYEVKRTIANGIESAIADYGNLWFARCMEAQGDE